MVTPSETDGPFERIAGRDDAAFKFVFDAYFDPLRRYVYRYVRSWDEAEDLIHDLFAWLWKRWHTLDVADIRSYLYTSARNRAINHQQHRQIAERWRRQRQGPALVPELDAFPDAERELLAAEASAVLQRAVDALPPRQREVILRRWRGDSHQRIATALSISPNTVSEHINRALPRLREALSDFLR